MDTVYCTGTLTPAEQQHLDRFACAALDARNFDHRAHVYVAWIYARLWRMGAMRLEEVVQRIGQGLRDFAVAAGVPEKYHQTITQAMILLVADAVAHDAGREFDIWCSRHPDLLGDFRLLIGAYYSENRLTSAAARAHFVAPDLRPLPEPCPC